MKLKPRFLIKRLASSQSLKGVLSLILIFFISQPIKVLSVNSVDYSLPVTGQVESNTQSIFELINYYLENNDKTYNDLSLDKYLSEYYIDFQGNIRKINDYIETILQNDRQKGVQDIDGRKEPVNGQEGSSLNKSDGELDIINPNFLILSEALNLNDNSLQTGKKQNPKKQPGKKKWPSLLDDEEDDRLLALLRDSFSNLTLYGNPNPPFTRERFDPPNIDLRIPLPLPIYASNDIFWLHNNEIKLSDDYIDQTFPLPIGSNPDLKAMYMDKDNVFTMNYGEIQADYAYVGNKETALFRQDGGVHLLSESLYLGFYENATGNYEFHRGYILSKQEVLGVSGKGIFSQLSGYNIVSEGLYIGSSIGESYKAGTGTYNLTGGILDTKYTIAGDYGTGEFYQSNTTAEDFAYYLATHSGNFAVGSSSLHYTQNLFVGYRSGSQGKYTLADGWLYADLPNGDRDMPLADMSGNNLESILAVSRGVEYIGWDGNGEFIQSGGTNMVFQLFLGYNPAGYGKYAQSGGTLDAVYEAIGFKGDGYFSQTGGINKVHRLYLGYMDGSYGEYLYNGGELIPNLFLIGLFGKGKFIHNSGNIDMTTGGRKGTVSIATHSNNSQGEYILNNGSLTTDTTAVGEYGKGYFTQNNGTHSTKQLLVGFNSGSYGEYTLANGSLSVSGSGSVDYGNTTVGYYSNSVGKFTQYGGSHTTNSLILAKNWGSTGYYNLLNGNLTTTTSTIANSGQGYFTQNGGSHSTTNVYLGNSIGSYGEYILNNGNFASNYVLVGVAGEGKFIQNGGIVDLMHSGIKKGLSTATNGANSKGTYILNNGVFTTETTGVGEYGRGYFEQYNGTHTTNKLLVGFNTGSYGEYTLADGNITVLPLPGGNPIYGTIDYGNTVVGYYSNSVGKFNQSGGSHTTNSLILGRNLNSTGYYNLSNGTLASTTSTIGNSGQGSFTQFGGNNNVNDRLIIGNASSSNGTYEQFGGNLTAYSIEIGGNYSTGTFIQRGGTSSTSWMTVGGSNGTGTYIMEGDAVQSVDLSCNIGSYGATGNFEHYGGKFNPKHFFLGYLYNATGNYNFRNGEINVVNYASIGARDAKGTFIQTGGIFNAPTLYIGEESGGKGYYNLTNGKLNVNNLYVGNQSFAEFIHTGGEASVFNLYLGKDTGSIVTYSITKGNLNIAGNIIGGSGANTLTYDGGTINLSGNISNLKNMYVGYLNSNVKYTQDKGDYSISNLYVGTEQTSGSEYKLTNGTLTTDLTQVANKFIQTAGTHISKNIKIGGESFSFDGETLPNTVYNHGLGKMVAFNNQIYLSGGYAWYSGRQINGAQKLELYNPDTNNWSELAPPLETKFHSSSFVIGDNIYIAGGQKTQDVFSNMLARYNTTTNTWTRMSNLPIRIHSTQSEVVGNKAYLLFGTVTSNYARPNLNPYIYEYDPALNAWNNKSQIPLSLNSATTETHDGKIYIFGGYYNNSQYGAPNLYRNEVQIYDTKTNSWYFGTPLPDDFYYSSTPYNYLNMGSIKYDDKVFIFSSVLNNEFELRKIVYIYDLLSDTWIKEDIGGLNIPYALHQLDLGLAGLDNTAYMLYNLFPGVAGDYVYQTGFYKLAVNINKFVGEYQLQGGVLDSDELSLLEASSFTQSGGQANIDFLKVGLNSKAVSSLNLINGNLSTLETSISGTSHITQHGGVHNINGDLWIGKTSGSKGNYSLLGGKLNVAGSVNISTGNSSGVFNIRGGELLSSKVNVGTETGSYGELNISSGKITADELIIGGEGKGKLNIDGISAIIQINKTLLFASNSQYTAVWGSTIIVNGADLVNMNTNQSALAGTTNTNLVFTGGVNSMEVAGIDFGADTIGFSDNFAFNSIKLEGAGTELILKNMFDNQLSWDGTEALYVNELILGQDTILDIGGYNVYFLSLTNNGGLLKKSVGNLYFLPSETGFGFSPNPVDIMKMNNRNYLNPVPEPGVMFLFVFGAFVLCRVIRVKRNNKSF